MREFPLARGLLKGKNRSKGVAGNKGGGYMGTFLGGHLIVSHKHQKRKGSLGANPLTN